MSKVILDYDANRSIHHLGVLEYKERNENWYKGFIYSIEVTLGVSEDESAYGLVSECNGACSVCPSKGIFTGSCLGICNWTHYWNNE